MRTIKSFFAYVAAAALALFAISCNPELIDSDARVSVPMQTVTITAGISTDNPQTKTAIGGKVDGTNLYKVVWSIEGEDDYPEQIGIIAMNSEGETYNKAGTTDPEIYPFTIQSGKGTETGIFTGYIPEDAIIQKLFILFISRIVISNCKMPSKTRFTLKCAVWRLSRAQMAIYYLPIK